MSEDFRSSEKLFNGAKKTAHRPGLRPAGIRIVLTIPVGHFRERQPVIFVVVADLLAQKAEAVLGSNTLSLCPTIFK